jgi:hypothetical protein
VTETSREGKRIKAGKLWSDSRECDRGSEVWKRCEWKWSGVEVGVECGVESKLVWRVESKLVWSVVRAVVAVACAVD